MIEFFNFCMEHWHVIAGVLAALVGAIWGKAGKNKITKAKDLIATVREALGDRYLSSEEVRKIKEDFEALLKK